jgi:chemotaxis protein MotB
MMNFKNILFLIFVGSSLASCVSTKKFKALQTNLDDANLEIGKCGKNLNEYMAKLSACEKEKDKLRGDLKTTESNMALRQEQINDLRAQVEDAKAQRDKQVTQVGNLTVLSQSANDNIKETLSQLEKKDKYIYLIQAAKTKADSINLALAVNLKGVLKDGLDDTDVDIKVDKTVVMINLSDKMLFQSGSSIITTRANDVLGKIAAIVESRPDVEVLVEGYTDNVPIKTACLDDNWDLSVTLHFRGACAAEKLQSQSQPPNSCRSWGI